MPEFVRRENTMKRIYANLLGEWIDITEDGTVEDHQDPSTYFQENLVYEPGSKVAKCFEYDYINIQYHGRNYRIHSSMIQIVSQ